MHFPTIEATQLEAMFEDRGNHMSTVKRGTIHYAQLFQKGHLSFGISSKGAVDKMPQCLMAGRELQSICLQSLSFMIPNESNGQLKMVFHSSDPPHCCAQRGQRIVRVPAFPLRSLQQSLPCSKFSTMHSLVSVATNL